MNDELESLDKISELATVQEMRCGNDTSIVDSVFLMEQRLFQANETIERLRKRLTAATDGGLRC